MTRFPHPDWSVLPLLETVYYVVGTYVEERRPRRADRRADVNLDGTRSGLAGPAWSGRAPSRTSAHSTEP